jgi:hypothetical protein
VVFFAFFAGTFFVAMWFFTPFHNGIKDRYVTPGNNDDR